MNIRFVFALLLFFLVVNSPLSPGYCKAPEYLSLNPEIKALSEKAQKLTDRKNFKEAEETYRIKLEKLKKLGGSDNDLGTTNHQIALCLIPQKKYKAAEEYLNKAIEHFKRVKYGFKIQTYIARWTQVDLYIKQSRYQEAEAVLKLIEKEIPSKECESYISYLETYSKVLSNLPGRQKEAESLQKQSQEIKKKIRNSSDIEKLVAQSVNAQFANENLKAEKLIVQAKALALKKYGKNDRRYAEILIQEANIHLAKKEFGKAEKLLREGLAIQKKVLKSDDNTILITTTILTGCLQKQGRTDEAMKVMRDSRKNASRAMESLMPGFGKQYDKLLETHEKLTDKKDPLKKNNPVQTGKKVLPKAK